MFKHDTQIRVRYGETDRMGYLYYGKYAEYFEFSRVEALRHLGITYKLLEDELGVMMPVATMEVKYLRPGFYDELLTVRTIIRDLPSHSAWFINEIYKDSGELMCRANLRLAFVKVEDKTRCDAPEALVNLLKPHWE